jgi:hypothetical protein
VESTFSSSGGRGNWYKIRVELRKKESKQERKEGREKERKKERKKENDYFGDLGVDGRLLSD